MKRLIVLLIIGAIGWQAYGKYQLQAKQPLVNEHATVQQSKGQSAVQTVVETPVTESPPAKTEITVTNNNYRCDGRIYCSQMKSCDEATWFLRNCPGTKMDGDHDGVPCEQQWCNK